MQTLLAEIKHFCATNRMSDTVFGLQSVNDSHLCMDIREGVSMTARRIERIRAFMASYKPPKKAGVRAKAKA